MVIAYMGSKTKAIRLSRTHTFVLFSNMYT